MLYWVVVFFWFEEFEYVCGFVFFLLIAMICFAKKQSSTQRKLLQVNPQAIIPETLHATGAKKFSKKNCQRPLRCPLYMYSNIYTYTLGYT